MFILSRTRTHTPATIGIIKGLSKLRVKYIQGLLFQQDAQVNLPSDTYLKDVTVYDYGGTITGLETFNISRGGAVKVYPPLASNPHFRPNVYDLNTISVLDGGSFYYYGEAEADDVFTVNLTGDLMIRGGGEMHVNKMKLNGELISTFKTLLSNCFPLL